MKIFHLQHGQNYVIFFIIVQYIRIKVSSLNLNAYLPLQNSINYVYPSIKIFDNSQFEK